MVARVKVAPVTLDDGDLVRRNAANRNYHAPWSAPFVDSDGFAAFHAAMQAPENCALVARHSADGSAIGVISFTRIARGNFLSAYCGYYGYAETAGQGLMREALALALGHAFGPLALHRVEANIQPGNMRSIRLVSSLGFRREGFSPAYLRIGGEWRDHERWALLTGELRG
ncbi:GNAT family N-acetyltransferase [Croceicoccus mobilis]|uniref:Acetyltransferase n=1 Tax=Croceicoccus mobilis TaxID=1703339 RepID=A0A916Z3C0_9SPHN|nr:GNAT family N-acetyltransferase [Croceicoccus mobilis]GGD71651.1 acetyltransferase [Croceicoccus mobilis]